MIKEPLSLFVDDPQRRQSKSTVNSSIAPEISLKFGSITKGGYNALYPYFVILSNRIIGMILL
jgi:hypothetical protein